MHDSHLMTQELCKRAMGAHQKAFKSRPCFLSRTATAVRSADGCLHKDRSTHCKSSAARLSPPTLSNVRGRKCNLHHIPQPCLTPRPRQFLKRRRCARTPLPFGLRFLLPTKHHQPRSFERTSTTNTRSCSNNSRRTVNNREPTCGDLGERSNINTNTMQLCNSVTLSARCNATRQAPARSAAAARRTGRCRASGAVDQLTGVVFQPFSAVSSIRARVFGG